MSNKLFPFLELERDKNSPLIFNVSMRDFIHYKIKLNKNNNKAV